MINSFVQRRDAAKKKSASERANRKLKCSIEQCGGRCLRAGERCRLKPTKEQAKIWGDANKAVKKASSTSPPASAPDLSIAERRQRELDQLRNEVHDSLQGLWQRSQRLSGERLAAFGDAVEKHLSVNAELKTEEWADTVQNQSTRLWDLAGSNPSIPETARERLARFMGDNNTREILSATKGNISDNAIDQTFGSENPVGRASLKAAQDTQRVGQVGGLVAGWARDLGQTGWQKATPAQKAKILSLLSPDEIEDIGIKFKKPPVLVKPQLQPKQENRLTDNTPRLDKYKTIGGVSDTQEIKKLTKTWDAVRNIPGVSTSWVNEFVSGKAKAKPDSFKGISDSKGNLQAGMIWSKNEDSIEIDYLVTAPWNQPNFPSEGSAGKYKKKAVKGAGTAAIVEAVKESQRSGLKGKVTLYSLPDAVPFYEKLGFKHKNLEEKRVGRGSTMELTPEQASKLAASYENKNSSSKSRKTTKTNGTTKTRTRN